MKIVWLRRALQDYDDILNWLDNHRSRASTLISQRIDRSVDDLLDFPLIGRPGRVPGTRELVVLRTPYIVAYRIAGHDIEILAVLHGARRWPESL